MTSLLISLAFGAFVAVMVWQLWHVFHVVPGENRQFMDRPPVGFRMVWPLIQALVHHCGEYFPQTQLNAAEQRLKRSGVEFVVSSQQFIAAKYVAAIVFGVVMAFVLSRFSHSVEKSSESPLRSELSRVLRDIRAGKPRATALRDLVERTGSQAVQNLVSTLIQAEKTGSRCWDRL